MKTIKKDRGAIQALRKIIGKTQVEFAVMIGVSKDAVASWETGRNQVSATHARRIELVTGADGRMLHQGVSIPFNQEGKEYTAEDFKRHQQTEWSDAVCAQRQADCVDTLKLLLRAAARTGGDKIRQRLPGLMDSFRQWSEGVREDFELGPEIDAQLRKRQRKVGMKQTYRLWRRMNLDNPEGLKASGYVDEPTKADEDELRLELELVPGWAPGRCMKWPKPAIMKLEKPAASGPQT